MTWHIMPSRHRHRAVLMPAKGPICSFGLVEKNGPDRLGAFTQSHRCKHANRAIGSKQVAQVSVRVEPDSGTIGWSVGDSLLQFRQHKKGGPDVQGRPVSVKV